ncbi:hypothetical protein [Streptomyces hygroscopicus]|uniref:hypothetical protein n=1 Tax=Streptomyces hygroscopicus TaxID=1912 RepID=UPI001FCB2EF4|nr:hypothetical protein [Streptomyces hygroscopicus]
MTTWRDGPVFATRLAAQGIQTTGTRGVATVTDKQVAGHNSPPLSSPVSSIARRTPATAPRWAG